MRTGHATGISLTTFSAVVSFAVALLCLPGCGGDDATNPPANSAPAASFTVDPVSGTTETVFQVDASGSSDAQDAASQLQVRWDWENDQTWDTDWSVTKAASHQYATSGEKTIKLQVKDTGGLSDDTTRTVSVGVPPSITVVFPNGGESWLGATIDTVKWTWTGAIDSVKIQCSTDGGSTWPYTMATTQNTGSYAMRAPNVSSTHCRVKISSVGNLAIYDVSDADFTITFQNWPPTAEFAVYPEIGTVDTVFQFDASWSSDGHDPLDSLEVRWDWENDGTYDTDWSTEKMASHQYNTVGLKTIKLQVKDTGELTAEATWTVTVGAPPTVLLTSPANGATDVSPYPTVEVWFSQALDVASLDTAHFHIAGVQGRWLFYDTIERKAILYPATALAPLTEYQVHLEPGIRSDAGFALGQQVTFSFTTGTLDCEHLRDRFEPNDDIASATQISSDGVYPGLSSCGGDERSDFFRFTLSEPLKIKVKAACIYADTQSVSWRIRLKRNDGETYTSLGTSVFSGSDVSTYHTFLPGTYWLETGKTYDDAHLVVYDLILEELPPAPDDQYEDNDFLDQATPITAGLYEGLRGAYVDADNYSIGLTAGQTVTATLTETSSTGTTRRLEILSAAGVYYTGHDGYDNPAVESWTATEAGTYVIHVRWWADNVIYNLNVEVDD